MKVGRGDAISGFESGQEPSSPGLLVQTMLFFRRQMPQAPLLPNTLDFRRYATSPHETDDSSVQSPIARRHFRSLFLSDMHLGAKSCRAERILDFLRTHDAETIYLVGDIFDGPLPRRVNWSPVHDAILQRLMNKALEGGRIVYLLGNHDDVFRSHCGVYLNCVEIVERTLHTTADGKRYLVLHGDCFDVVARHAPWLSRLGYHVDRAVRRVNAALDGMRRSRGLAEWSMMNAIVSSLNSLITGGQLFEGRLKTLAREHGAAGVICGHFHCAAIHERFGSIYANCGDWLESCTAIAEDADGSLQIINWRKPLAAAPPSEVSFAAETANMIGA